MDKKSRQIDITYPLYIPALIAFLILVLPVTKFWFNSVGHRWVYVLLFSSLLTYILVPLAQLVAIKEMFLDLPDSSRKLHMKGTPLLGGLAIFVSFIVSLAVNYIFSKELVGILIAVSLIIITGLLDVKFHLRAAYRLIVQIAAAAIVIYTGTVLTIFPSHTPLWYLNIPFTFLWILGLTNAMNFLDGMDGLAAGISVIISTFIGILAYQNNQPFLGWTAIAIVGGCLGFLPYNLKLKDDASIFLGDSGSNFLGFVLACMAINGDWSENSIVVSALAPVLIFSVLIYDMFYITIDRYMTGKIHNFTEWVEYTGRDHLHHRLDALLHGKRKTVLFIFLLNIGLGCSALALRNADTADSIILVVQGVVFLTIVTILERIGNKIRLNGESQKNRHQENND